MRKKMSIAAALLCASGLTAGGFDVAGATQPRSTGSPDAVEGCGEGSWTDPTTWTNDRAVARCEPGSPAPQPLAERTTISVSSNPTEFALPIWAAIEFGEFEKENLEVQFLPVGGADAFTQLVAGALEVTSFSPGPAFINGALDGNGVQWVAGSHVGIHMGDASIPQGGSVWARRDAFSDPDNPDLSELAGERLATTVAGAGSITTTWLGPAFEAAGLEFGTDIVLEGMDSADAFLALETGAFNLAYLIDPYWRQAAADPDQYVQLLVADKIPYSGWFFGDDLLNQRPEVGDAFIRAYIRTINTYLDGDYYADPEIVALLAERLGVEESTFTGEAGLAFDWEMPVGLVDTMQEWAVRLGLQTADPRPEGELINRTFIERAVGHSSE